MIEIEVDELVLCVCGNDLATDGSLCAGCAAEQEALLAWAEAKGWPRLELRPYLAIAEGEDCWRAFLGYPEANAKHWAEALARAGL